METLFLLQHLHVHANEEEDIKIIGIFESIDKATAAIDSLKAVPGFCDFPDLINSEGKYGASGFYIDEYVINMINWEDGYTTVIY